jgi:chaperone required for assembly of F1-ATPase
VKRWYKRVVCVPAGGGFAVALDGKTLNTPMRAPVVAPTQALAQAIAAEWDAQGDVVAPAAMHLTRLAATALDRIGPDPSDAVAEIAGYAGSDLLCHRAERPAELVRRQDAAWQPILDWAARRYGARLAPVAGVIPAAQPRAALDALKQVVAALDHFRLAGLHGATISSGSLLLGLALLEAHADIDRVWEAAELDEAWQREGWGDDPLAAKHRAGVEAELRAAARFLDLLGA